jgi:filamentous hemagglutinin family protein
MSRSAITLLRSRYLAILRRCATLNAMGMLGTSLLMLQGMAQAAGTEIVPDGRTATTVTPSPTGIGVSTGTIRGVTGLNSFSRFNVGAGDTVNLNLPAGTHNLVNLVSGSASTIDGVLNAYKDGRIGGNVFFLNPQGVVVGASGQIRVGSLLMAAPTQGFMDSLLGSGGLVGDAALAQALAGSIPLSDSGLISVKGQIMATDGVMLRATHVEVGAGARVMVGQAVAVAFGSLVNVDGLQEGGATFMEGDQIRIVANDRITVGEGALLSTRNVANVATADHALAASLGDSGSLSLTARHIEIQAGAQLLAQADHGFAAGDVSLLATETNAIGADRTADTSILLDRATVRGHDILIRSQSDTSLIAQVLANDPSTSLSQAQSYVDNEVAGASDGPGGEFLAIKTVAKARTEVRGSTIAGSGDVTIDSQAFARAGFKKTATADTVIGDALATNGQPAVRTQITGRNVSITAQASTSYKLNVLGTLVKLADQSWLPDPDNSTLTLLNDQLFDFGSVPLVSLSSAKANVLLDGATAVTATKELTLASDATSEAQPNFSSPFLFAAAWAESTAEAHTQVLGTSALTAGQTARVKASTDVEVAVDANVTSTNKPIDAVFVRGQSHATTLAETGAGTVIRAGSIALSADNESDIAVSGAARNKGGSGLGIAVAVNESDNTVTARLGGDAAASSGDVKVTATIDMARDATSADAATLGDPSGVLDKLSNFKAGIQRNVSSGILSATGLLKPAAADKLSNFMFPGIKEGKFNASGAVIYADAHNTAQASIADGAKVKAAGALDVTSSITDRPSSGVGAKTTSTGSAIGGAVALASFSNTAQAWIGKGAVVDAQGALRVDAQTLVPYPWQIDWTSPKAILNHLQGNVLGMVFTSYGINSAKGKSGAGVAAAVTVFDMNSTSEAFIDDGARINTLSVPTSAQPLPGQSVTVFARNEVNTVNAVGILGTKVLGTSGGQAAVGGAANILDIEGSASATIRGQAEVRSATSVTVEAEQLSRLVTVTEAGGSSDNVGVEGAVSVNTVTQTTLAAIDDDARIHAGGLVKVHALGDFRDISVAGGVVATKGSVGIGFSVSLNTIDTSTSAFVGNVDAAGLDAAGALGEVNTAGALNVNAESGTEVGAYSLVGAVATSSSAQTDAPGSGESSTQSGQSGAGKGKFGIAVSGDASVNDIHADTSAYLADGVKVTQATDVSVKAHNTLAINALAGAVTVSTQKEGNGLAGSFASNTLGGSTLAYVDGATLSNKGAVSVSAEVDGEINTLSASVEASQGKLGVAGSVSVNELTHTTQAYVADSTLKGLTGLSVSAANSAAIRAVAGALAFGGKAGIGLSFAWNRIGNDTLATVRGSDVDTTGAVSVLAQSSSEIDTVAASLGASKGNLAGAGAVAINEINSQTVATVEGQHSAAGIHAASMKVGATDASGINAIVGALGASSGQAAFGVSFAWNQINTVMDAALLSTTVVTTGTVDVTASHTGDIASTAVGGAAANKVGVSGSLAINDIGTQAKARSVNSSVLAQGSVGLSASDTAKVSAITGALSGGGTAAVGASGSYNHLNAKVQAQVSGGSLVSQAGSVDVTAQREGAIEVWAASGAGGGTAGFAGSIAINDLGGETSALVADGANVKAAHNVLVQAVAADTIDSQAGTVALGGTVGGGGAVTVNDLHSQTTADVSGTGTVLNALAQGGTQTVLGEALRGTAVVAQSTSQVSSILANASGGGTAGVAATVSVNMLGGGTTAQVRDGAAVQASATGAGSTQQARVAASHADKVDVVVGGLAVGGEAGVGGAVDTTTLAHTTLAQVQNAKLAARSAVGVTANSTATTKQTVVGAAGGGSASVNLSGTVLLAKTSTQALADDATLQSQGSLTVVAASDLSAEHIVGGLSASGAAGIGASVAVTVAEQATRAATSGSSQLDAKGLTQVKASSGQSVEVIAATASAAGAVGVAGSVAVTVLKGQTEASVGAASRLNQNAAFSTATQDVRVTAADQTHVDNKLGALGVGIGGGGVGAVADVVLVNTGVSATVAAGAQVKAGRDIVLDAQAQRDIGSLAVAAAGGYTVGISGAVSYIGVGGVADAGAQSELMGSVGQASSIGSGSAAGNQAGADAGGGLANTQRADAARSGINLTQDFSTASTGHSALAAVGAGAKLDAGRDVSVSANTSTQVKATAVGVAVSGGVSLGGGVAIASVADAALASLAGSVTAHRNVSVLASSLQPGASALKAYAGGGGLVGLGASVALFDQSSTAQALIAADAVVSTDGSVAADAGKQTGLVRVDAQAQHQTTTEALGAAVGVAGVGAAMAHSTEQGQATAGVGDRAQISAKALDVYGHSQTTAQAEATAAAGGILSGAGVDALAQDKSLAQATLGQAVTVHTAGGLSQVRADVDPAARAKALGAAVSAGVSIGVSLAKADVAAQALALTGSQLLMDTGSLAVSARTLQRAGSPTASASAVAVAGGALLGAGATAVDAIVHTTTQAKLGEQAHVTASDDLLVSASSTTSGTTSATGVYAGLLAGGSNRATTQANTTTLASVGDGAKITSADQLGVTATGADTLFASTVAGAGGLGTLVASTAETQATSTTTAALGTAVGTGGAFNANTQASTLANALANPKAKAKSVNVQADQTTHFNATADSTNASVLGYSGARAINHVDTHTTASLGSEMSLSAESLTVQAANHVVKAALASGFNVESASGGLLNGAAARSETWINNHAITSVGNWATVSVNVAGLTNSGVLDLSAFNEVDAHDGVHLDAGGAIAVARSESLIHNDTNEGKVLLGSQATLLSDGEVNLSARTSANVVTASRTSTYGGAGAAQGETVSSIGVDNQVNISSHALIEAEGDVHLMAGTNRSVGNQLNADADTRLWNHTAVPIETDPDAYGSINQLNTIDLAQGARVRSVRSVYLSASEGTHTTRGFGEGTDSYREVLSAIGSFFGADTSSLKITGGSTYDNARDPLTPTSGVNVDGVAEAGIWHLQYLTYKADGTYEKSQNVSFSVRDNVNLSTELADQIAQLKAKAEAVRTSANNYVGDSNAADVALALDNDAKILESQLAALNANTKVGFLDVAPVLATTGNVNVTGRYLTGASTGQLIAPGDVRIDIENQSLRFMTTSTLTIPDEDGGQVTLNGLRVSSASDINGRNSAGRTTALTVKDALSTPQPVIRIENTNSNDTATGLPPQLWIEGDVTNLGGLADAKSHGTIRASGNINAETITIATGGDFIKTYTPGFTHQGGNPISQLGSLPGSKETAAMNLGGSDAADNAAGDYSVNSLSLNCSNGVCSSTIAGNNVYISGEKLNINGLIQAGLADRAITITADMISAKAGAISAAKAAYKANPGTASQYLDINNPDPASTDIKVRYDLLNDRLELDNVRIGGGHLELFGNIFSTGNGELRVLDGYGRINVANNSGYDIVINKLDAGQGIEGMIRITDTAKRVVNGAVDASGTSKAGVPLVTEITRLGNTMETRDSRTVDADGRPTYVVSDADGRSTAYDPVANRRFNWINGRTQDWTEQAIYAKTFAVIVGQDVDSWSPDYDKPDRVIPGTPVYTQRLTGDWLSVGGGNAAYQMDYTQVTSPKVQGATYQISNDCDCYLGEGKRTIVMGTDFTWNVKEYFHHSLYASNAIKVNFIGYDTAKVAVASKTGQVLLNGMVRGLTGDTTITAANGIQSLSEQAVIVGQNVTLSAVNGAIGSAAKPVQINLTDANAARGLLDGTLTATARDGIAIKETDGDLRIAALKATAGALNISADRHINTALPGTVLQGREVHLVSVNGAIGTAGAPLRIDTDAVAGVLSAQALGDINLTEVSGDLRVVQVASGTGDVTLNVPTGRLIDANTVDREDTLTATELLALWDTLGLRGNAAQARADQTVLSEQRRVEAEYQAYWQMRNVKVGANGQYTADAYDPAFRFTLSPAQASALKAANGWTDTDVANYEQAQTTAFHQAHVRFGAQAYQAGFSYTATTQEAAALREGAAWSDSELSTALGAGLFRAVADTEVRIEDPNVIGRNLHLNVAGSIGEDAGVMVISRSKDTSTLSKDERLALLTAEKQDLELTDTEIRIALKKDVDVQLSGNLVADAGGPILIGSESDLAIEHVASAQEVRIKTGAGLSNAAADGVAAVTASRLVLEAGQGSIGSASKAMLVDVADGGSLTARARQNVAITEATGDMVIGSVYGQQAVTLTAPGAILDGGLDSLTDVQSRQINLVAGTTIGTDAGAPGALEIKLGLNGQVNASAPDGIYLASAGQSSQLGNISTQGRFALTVGGGDLTVAGQVKAKSIKLAADDDIVLLSTGTLGASEFINLAAGTDGQGDVLAEASSGPQLNAPVVTVSAPGAIGGTAPLWIASADVQLSATNVNARIAAAQALTLTVQGAGSQPASTVALDLSSTQGTTLTRLDAAQAVLTVKGDLSLPGNSLASAGRFSFAVGGGDITVAGPLQVRTLDMATDGDIVLQPAATVAASESLALAAGTDGQGSVLAASTAGPQLSAPRVSVSAANAVGGAQPLWIASPDVTLAGDDVQARISSATPLRLSAQGAPAASAASGTSSTEAPLASQIALDIDSPSGSTISRLSAVQSRTTLNGALTVLDGRVGDVATFFTPWYDIRIDAQDRRAQPAFDVHAFTLTGRYDLIVGSEAAQIGAYVLTSNPEKIVSSNPGGVTNGVTQTGNALNGEDDQAGARGLALARNVQDTVAPAAGLLRIGSDLFNCKGHEAECEARGLSAPTAPTAP